MGEIIKALCVAAGTAIGKAVGDALAGNKK